MLYSYAPSYEETFKDKIAIVTGGASGIGESIAEGLTLFGAKVCILDINRDKGLDMESMLNDRENPKSHFYETDVSKPDSIKRTVENIVKEAGSPWILVNNAGIEYGNAGNLITMPYDKMMDIVNTNFLGYVNMLREVVPHMEKNGGGRIVNISSVQATQSCLPGTIYQPVKQGILGLARVMTLEYAKKNIRTNTISPGDVKTEGMGRVWLENDPHALDCMKRSLPLGRRAHPMEIANVALFLLSESASYIHGQEIVVDGGMLNTLYGDMGIPQTPVEDDPD